MLRIDWTTYHSMIQELDKKILDLFEGDKPIHIAGIPRGGSVAALHLSYLHNKYIVHPDVYKENIDFTGNRIAVIDDVLETGRTRVDLIKHFKLSLLPCFVVLVDKSQLYNIPPADVSILKIDTKIWVKFYYESEQAEEVSAQKVYGKEDQV